jgi:hypothetical protein
MKIPFIYLNATSLHSLVSIIPGEIHGKVEEKLSAQTILFIHLQSKPTVCLANSGYYSGASLFIFVVVV